MGETHRSNVLGPTRRTKDRAVRLEDGKKNRKEKSGERRDSAACQRAFGETERVFAKNRSLWGTICGPLGKKEVTEIIGGERREHASPSLKSRVPERLFGRRGAPRALSEEKKCGGKKGQWDARLPSAKQKVSSAARAP